MAQNRARSRGQELLQAAGGTLKELAARLGTSESAVSRLRSGATAEPSEELAAALEQELAIPRAAWRERAASEPAASEPGPAAESADPRAHLADCRAWRRKLEADRASAKDITAALEAERRAIELVRKASEEDAEETIEIILRALEAYPEAKAAVAEALRDG